MTLLEFKCPTCGMRAWAEAGTRLACIICTDWSAVSELGGYMALRSEQDIEQGTFADEGDAMTRVGKELADQHRASAGDDPEEPPKARND